MPKSTRAEVFEVLSEERDYQESLPPSKCDCGNESIGEIILTLEHFIAKARTTRCQHGDLAALEEIREIGAMAVACMEVHGAFRRRPKQLIQTQPADPGYRQD